MNLNFVAVKRNKLFMHISQTIPQYFIEFKLIIKC